MKIRTDFVTNSSSSSFTLTIKFDLVNGERVEFIGEGATGETGPVDYFDGEVLVTVSPKQLGTAKTVEDMIQMLTDGVIDNIDGWDDDGVWFEEQVKIFEKSNPKKDEWGWKCDAYDFIKEIREKIEDMDDIKSISIEGDEENQDFSYLRKYDYNRSTKKYGGTVVGEEFEKDGSSGGDLQFKTSGCEVVHIDKNIENIVIPEGVTSICDSAFNGCSSLTSITIPEGVTSIGSYAFAGCSSLTSITIPEGVTSIGNWAFDGCISLTSITIPEGVMSIGSWAFNGCSSLTSITIPEGVTSIGEGAFAGCSSLASITIPESVMSIGSKAFIDCYNLEKLSIGNSKCKLKLKIFGDTLPPKLAESVSELCLYMAGGDLKSYILVEKVWEKLILDTQVEIFNTHQEKVVLPAYHDCIKNPEVFGEKILSGLSDKPLAKQCKAAVNFMVIFANDISAELLNNLYETLKPIKSAAKALKLIEEDQDFMQRLNIKA